MNREISIVGAVEQRMPHVGGDEPHTATKTVFHSCVCPTDVGRYKNEGDDANMKNLQELPKLKDSISYLYIEHAIIDQGERLGGGH